MHKFSAMELTSIKLFLAQINFRNSTEWTCCTGHHTSGVHLTAFGPLCLNGHKGYIPQHSSAVSLNSWVFIYRLVAHRKKHNMVFYSAQLIIINESR